MSLLQNEEEKEDVISEFETRQIHECLGKVWPQTIFLGFLFPKSDAIISCTGLKVQIVPKIGVKCLVTYAKCCILCMALQILEVHSLYLWLANFSKVRTMSRLNPVFDTFLGTMTKKK